MNRQYNAANEQGKRRKTTFFREVLTFTKTAVIMNDVADEMLLSDFYGLVVQLVRTLACHARGRGFEPHPGRHFLQQKPL